MRMKLNNITQDEEQTMKIKMHMEIDNVRESRGGGLVTFPLV